MPSIKAIESGKSPLQADLAQRIGRLIKEGSFVPGQHLTAKGLAELYDVSRTPIRQALMLLEEQGFVESRANTGFRVARNGSRLKLDRLTPKTVTEDELFRRMIADRGRGALAGSFTDAEVQLKYGSPKSMLTRVLVRLTQEGLIERRKGHGWSFTESLDDKDAHDESYRFRAAVECAGLRDPSFKAVPDEMKKSRDTHERFLDQAGNAKAASQFSEMNLEFHQMLARFSGNRFIARAVHQQNQLRRFLVYSYFDDRSVSLIESTKEHLQVIDALEQDDREWAATLMMRHLSESSRR